MLVTRPFDIFNKYYFFYIYSFRNFFFFLYRINLIYYFYNPLFFFSLKKKPLIYFNTALNFKKLRSKQFFYLKNTLKIFNLKHLKRKNVKFNPFFFFKLLFFSKNNIINFVGGSPHFYFKNYQKFPSIKKIIFNKVIEKKTDVKLWKLKKIYDLCKINKTHFDFFFTKRLFFLFFFYKEVFFNKETADTLTVKNLITDSDFFLEEYFFFTSPLQYFFSKKNDFYPLFKILSKRKHSFKKKNNFFLEFDKIDFNLNENFYFFSSKSTKKNLSYWHNLFLNNFFYKNFFYNFLKKKNLNTFFFFYQNTKIKRNKKTFYLNYKFHKWKKRKKKKALMFFKIKKFLYFPCDNLKFKSLNKFVLYQTPLFSVFNKLYNNFDMFLNIFFFFKKKKNSKNK